MSCRNGFGRDAHERRQVQRGHEYDLDNRRCDDTLTTSTRSRARFDIRESPYNNRGCPALMELPSSRRAFVHPARGRGAGVVRRARHLLVRRLSDWAGKLLVVVFCWMALRA